MLNEKIDISKADPKLIQDIIKRLNIMAEDKTAFTVAICGESGSGKSVISQALYQKLKDQSVKVYLFKMDNYFKLPPQQNSAEREKNLSVVGSQEVDLMWLDDNILSLKRAELEIERPIVDFSASSRAIIKEQITEQPQIILVEGTYVSLLENVDCRIFIERTYLDTHIHRRMRMREPQTELIESVLAIEHEIVKHFVSHADLIVSKKYELQD